MKQKGAALKSLLGAIEKVHGRSKLAAVVAALPEQIRAQVTGQILPVAWYRIEVLAAVHASVRDVLGHGRWDESHRLGREAAKIDFRGMYRVLLRAVHYDSIWDRICTAWSNYNSRGEVKMTVHDRGHATGIVHGVLGFNEGQWRSIAGRTEQLIILAGARAAEVEVHDPTSTSARLEGLYFD